MVGCIREMAQLECVSRNKMIEKWLLLAISAIMNTSKKSAGSEMACIFRQHFMKKEHICARVNRAVAFAVVGSFRTGVTDRGAGRYN